MLQEAIHHGAKISWNFRFEILQLVEATVDQRVGRDNHGSLQTGQEHLLLQCQMGGIAHQLRVVGVGMALDGDRDPDVLNFGRYLQPLLGAALDPDVRPSTV